MLKKIEVVEKGNVARPTHYERVTVVGGEIVRMRVTVIPKLSYYIKYGIRERINRAVRKVMKYKDFIIATICAALFLIISPIILLNLYIIADMIKEAKQ